MHVAIFMHHLMLLLSLILINYHVHAGNLVDLVFHPTLTLTPQSIPIMMMSSLQ